MQVSDETILKFDKAKIAMLSKGNNAFFATMLFSMKHEWTEEIQHMDTNGDRIRINPEYFNQLTPKAAMTLLAKLTLHVALYHVVRRGNRDPKKWQLAADYTVTPLLEEAGYELPEEWSHDRAYSDMSVEEIYELIEDQEPPEDQQQNIDPEAPEGDGKGDPEGDGNGGKSDQQREQEITEKNIEASTQSKMRGEKPGSVPGDINRDLDKLLNPQLPWDQLLNKYLNEMDKTDYTFAKPNRRFLHEGIYLPSLHGQALDHLAVVYDVSGSVSQEDLTAYYTETHKIKETYNPKLMTMIAFDTQIQQIHEVTQDQDVQSIKFTGGGGTDIRPIFEHFSKPGNKPNALIIFSDLYCHIPEEDPGFDVIWICVNGSPDQTVPYGKLIMYDSSKN